MLIVREIKIMTTMRYLLPVRMGHIKNTETSVLVGIWKKREFFFTTGGNAVWLNLSEKQYEGFWRNLDLN